MTRPTLTFNPGGGQNNNKEEKKRKRGVNIYNMRQQCRHDDRDVGLDSSTVSRWYAGPLDGVPREEGLVISATLPGPCGGGGKHGALDVEFA